MKTVFLDVDTQIDFVFPCGALYVPGAEKILPNVAALGQFALKNGFPLISTTDAHAENDPEFHFWPAHCVAGTIGQRKPSATLFAQGQTILEKQVYDMFARPDLGHLLDRLNAERYVVYGVVTEVCVRHAVSGLVKLEARRIQVVTDAICAFNPDEGAEALREFSSAGATLTTTAAILNS